ncbi:hypothetical protein [Massilia pseudoviolaceinigra]|uniref:hypothetical protein n=1 Tax=Massilia pseudoviolaceinigra TaxID=3057165 RepID=UPI002796BE65|nr:hypothetical protein [Massilia sp. CCM 9206]MDQ1919281.1 TonB-dependent receptor [Massilia sp. CCM 9206]
MKCVVLLTTSTIDKLAARYDFTPAFGLRGSLQNGFRPPSPQEQFYTSTWMTFIDAQAFNIVRFIRINGPAIKQQART